MNQDNPDTGGAAGDDRPKVLIRPPFLFLAVIVVGLALHWLDLARWSFWLLAGIVAILGFFLILVGLLMMAAAIMQFSSASTNVRSDLPTLALVKNGIYALSRNPIYVGMTLITAGFSFVANVPVILLCLSVGLVILRFGVVSREEAFLTRKFGDDYLQYKKRVGRWFWKF